MEIRYCRRDVNGRPCHQKIARANAMDWCEEHRARLPFWPTDTTKPEIQAVATGDRK